ncbi:glycosyl transferase [Rhizobium tubonense]|uniref:Glycosyl transferase n=1 Tax=Rhizobium tubonense TaxID=484088 RepID=A0A2W4CSC5_9HYPH|nr:glycosyl transferase [Rhizobium tubonense]PZM13748.1 glycosyl transferase [Rhizobium tubonense]
MIKSGALLLLGSPRAHVQDWFPGLRIDLDTTTGARDVRYRGEKVVTLSGADLLRERSPENVYIVGSGPSVRNCDLSRLEEGSAILLNGAITLIGEQIAMPLAIAIEDERFIWRHFDLVKEKVAADTVCLLSVAVLRAICEHDRRWLRDKKVVLIDYIRKPYGERRRSIDMIARFDFVVLNEDRSAAISLLPDRGVVQGGSVAVSVLQFALYCRPRTIGLFGIDISNADQPRFYETGKQTAFSGIAGAEKRIVAHLVLAKKTAGEHNVEVMNFSPVSILVDHGFGYDGRFAVLKDDGSALPSP